MRHITASDLTFTSDAELRAMLCEATESLQYMHIGSDEYTATLSSIQVIRRALAQRRMGGPKF